MERHDQAIVIGDMLMEDLETVWDVEKADDVEIGIVVFPNSLLTVMRDERYDREAFQLMHEKWNGERHPVWVCIHEEAASEEEDDDNK